MSALRGEEDPQERSRSGEVFSLRELRDLDFAEIPRRF